MTLGLTCCCNTEIWWILKNYADNVDTTIPIIVALLCNLCKYVASNVSPWNCTSCRLTSAPCRTQACTRLVRRGVMTWTNSLRPRDYTKKGRYATTPVTPPNSRQLRYTRTVQSHNTNCKKFKVLLNKQLFHKNSVPGMYRHLYGAGCQIASG
jgi:hypothetical protein